MSRRRLRAREGLVAAVLLPLALATGCGGEQPTQGPPAGHETDHADGSGDMAGMDGTDEMAGMPSFEEPPASADWNAADATYLSMMVAHHSQALDLAELAAAHAANPGVRRIAASIDAGQGREIITMSSWLVDHDLPAPTVDGVAAMTRHGMPGMLTTSELDALGEKRGEAFDRQFLEDMIRHHEGAIAMAQEVMGTGESVVVAEWATEVVTGQQGEIDRMRELL